MDYSMDRFILFLVDLGSTEFCITEVMLLPEVNRQARGIFDLLKHKELGI